MKKKERRKITQNKKREREVKKKVKKLKPNKNMIR